MRILKSVPPIHYDCLISSPSIPALHKTPKPDYKVYVLLFILNTNKTFLIALYTTQGLISIGSTLKSFHIIHCRFLKQFCILFSYFFCFVSAIFYTLYTRVNFQDGCAQIFHFCWLSNRFIDYLHSGMLSRLIAGAMDSRSLTGSNQLHTLRLLKVGVDHLRQTNRRNH